MFDIDLNPRSTELNPAPAEAPAPPAPPESINARQQAAASELGKLVAAELHLDRLDPRVQRAELQTRVLLGPAGYSPVDPGVPRQISALYAGMESTWSFLREAPYREAFCAALTAALPKGWQLGPTALTSVVMWGLAIHCNNYHVDVTTRFGAE